MVKALNSIFRSFGFEVKRYIKPNYKWIKDLNINSVIDIGANEGQFASFISEVLPHAKIFSFEPLESCFIKLRKTTSYLNIELFNFALGEENTQDIIYTSSHSPSSSLLKMQDLHKRIFLKSNQNTQTQSIEIKRLDDVAENFNLTPNLLIKIDVQGYENKVIKGGEKTIQLAKVILIEMSYYSLYENQYLFDDIYAILKKEGFEFKGNFYQSINPETGLPLYSDAIFIKNA